MKSNRAAHKGFTLIEILIACMLLGIGATSLIAVLMVGLQRSRQVTAMTTMGPVATAAANLCAVNNQIPNVGNTDFIILPDTTTPPSGGIRPAFAFSSPYALRIDRAPNTSASDPTNASYDPGSPLLDAGAPGTDDAQLVTVRVKVYDNAEHRDADIRRLGTMFIRVYLRPRQ